MDRNSNSNPQTQLSELKDDFEAKINLLQREAERLKSVYPFQDLLTAKQLEVDRMRKTLGIIPLSHPERKTIESRIEECVVEQVELCVRIEAAKLKFKALAEQIQSTSDSLRALSEL